MSKIVHVIIAANYREGFGYQENILPWKHKELGFDVTIITQQVQGMKAPCEYINNNDVKVVVLKAKKAPFKKIPLLGTLSKAWTEKSVGLYDALLQEKPDIIFIHNVLAKEHLQIVKYKKTHPTVKIFADNHEDYYNSAVKGGAKAALFTAGRYIASRLLPYTEKFWGVTPWRVDYLQKVYRIPSEKTGLLVMGGDEKLVNWEKRDEVRQTVRNKYGIPSDAFLVISGGKINRTKNVHLLVEAIKQIPNVWLMIFGNYEKDMVNYPDTIQCDRIINIGWMDSNKVYDLFLASDLGCFPGTHSVLWEQACASGLPCVFKDWNGGFNHVDLGGNCILMKEPTIDKLITIISEMKCKASSYIEIKKIASTKAREYFSYNKIAQRSIGIV